MMQFIIPKEDIDDVKLFLINDTMIGILVMVLESQAGQFLKSSLLFY